MKLANLKFGILALVVIGMVACGKNKSDNSAGVRGRGTATPTSATTNPTTGLPTQQVTPVNSQGAYVVVADQYQAQFDEAIKVLVSPTVDPSTVGSVNTRTGVQVRGAVQVQQGGAVLNTSRVQLLIQDIGGSESTPISILVAGASGTVSGSQVNINFTDEYGTITITGTLSSTTFNGRVSFANNTQGYNGKSSGTLGDFTIPTCSFFVCQ